MRKRSPFELGGAIGTAGSIVHRAGPGLGGIHQVLECLVFVRRRHQFVRQAHERRDPAKSRAVS
jgi:hypothetical protein